MSEEKKTKPLRLGGEGELYDSGFIETQMERDARWHYFKAICRNNPYILDKLTSEVHPNYVQFLELIDAKGIEASVFRIHTVRQENGSYLLTANGPQIAVRQIFTTLKVDQKEFVDRLTKFQSLLEAISKTNNRMNSC